MTVYFAVGSNGIEIASNVKPERYETTWLCLSENFAGWDDDYSVILPKGTIKKLTGKELTWNDEPIEMEVDWL